ncbi:ParA family protein [Sphaerisporangium rhizosphaerae]|uniref:ParA family protein n=1 Tax=Sphaerisporangium rhizosphaerae TaxID=2269375 RepID=A0ABW2PHQ0_9ACTN
MAKVTTVLNQKGGVGKSTLAVNLAAVLAETAHPDEKTVAVSIDPQGSATWWSDQVTRVFEELSESDPARAESRALPFDFIQAHDDVAGLATMPDLAGVGNVVVDTPGWIDLSGSGSSADPLGSGDDAKALRVVLDSTHDVLVPVEPEPLGFQPTWNTIEKVVKPRGLSFLVVINNWDPRDGRADLEQTEEFILQQGWPLSRTVIRHYKIHTRASAEGLVVTQYPKNRVAMEAREDFYRLALELGQRSSR